MLYAGGDGFLERAVPFVNDNAADGAAVMVAVPPPNYDNLRRAVTTRHGDRVRILDMTRVGRNPARIIPAWTDFATEHAGTGRPLRGIGEPIWAGRSPEEMDECIRHESLLNLAFAGTSNFILLCPYDVAALAPGALGAAHSTHPSVADLAGEVTSGAFDAECFDPFSGELPDPPADAVTVPLRDARSAGLARRVVLDLADRAGLSDELEDGLVVAVSEVAANAVRHGRGGCLTAWIDGDTFVCNVQGGDRMVDPLVGRRRPDLHGTSGRGVWLANQLCDLVQIRSDADRNAVRIHVRRRDPRPA